MAEKAIEKNIPLYLCFIDYEKAFDRLKHDKLIEFLQKIGLDERDVQLIYDAYWNQETKMRIDDRETGWIPVKKGVRQGCVLSPLMYNLYSEMIMKEVFEDREEGVKINGRRINNLRYADDTVIITESEEDLQLLLDDLYSKSKELGLTINTKKTKTWS